MIRPSRKAAMHPRNRFRAGYDFDRLVAASPALAGALFAASFQALPLLIGGTLMIVYDLLLLAQFWGVKPPEEE